MKKEVATLAGGCFWCIEAIFNDLKGVENVKSGYTGGDVENPSYEQVCNGSTGHAEAIQITFDPKIISYKQLLEVFWRVHNPTTLNRQGADVGTQYRSVIFYHNDQQKQIAVKSKKELEKQKVYDSPVVTKIEPFTKFYEAEKYHQDYYTNNPSQGYCQIVIDPKVQKFRKDFKKYLKN